MRPVNMAILAVVGAAVVVYLTRSGATALVDTAKTIGAAVDPTNPDNVVASGINKVGSVLVSDGTGPGKNADGSWTLGGWLYDITNPGTAQAVKDATQSTSAGNTGSW